MTWPTAWWSSKRALSPSVPGAKKTAGTLYIGGVGDSTIEGVGQDPTGDGSDGLRFGGAPVPAGVTFIRKGVTLTHWPDTGGAAGANPGIWPHVAQAALDAGYEEVVILAWGTSSAITSGVRANEWLGLANYAAANGIELDLVLVGAGTNDGQNGENAAFEVAAPALLTDIEESHRSARVCWFQPVALAEGSYPEADLVRADIVSLMDDKPTRGTVAGLDKGRADDAHPSLQGYKDQGEEAIEWFEGAP